MNITDTQSSQDTQEPSDTLPLPLLELLSNIHNIPLAKEILSISGVDPSTSLLAVTLDDHGPSFAIETTIEKGSKSSYPEAHSTLDNLEETPAHEDKRIYLLDVYLDSFPIPQSTRKILSKLKSRKAYTVIHFRRYHTHTPSCPKFCFINTGKVTLGRVVDECLTFAHQGVMIDTQLLADLTYRKEIPQNIFIKSPEISDIKWMLDDKDALNNLDNSNVSPPVNLSISSWHGLSPSAYNNINTSKQHNEFEKQRSHNNTKLVSYEVNGLVCTDTTRNLSITDCHRIRYLSFESIDFPHTSYTMSVTMVPRGPISDDLGIDNAPLLEFIDGRGVTQLSIHSYAYIPRLHDVTFPDLEELSIKISTLKDVDFFAGDVDTGILPLISQVTTLKIELDFELTHDILPKLTALGNIVAPNLKHLKIDVGFNDPGAILGCNVWQCYQLETLVVITEIGFNYSLKVLQDFRNATSIRITTKNGANQLHPTLNTFIHRPDRPVRLIFKNLVELEVFTGKDMMQIAPPDSIFFPKLTHLRSFGQYVHWRHQGVVFNNTTCVYTLSFKAMPAIVDVDLSITLGRQTLEQGLVSTGTIRDFPRWDSCGSTLQLMILSSAPKLERLHVIGDVCCLSIQGSKFTSLHTIDMTEDVQSEVVQKHLKRTPQLLTMSCPIAYNFYSRWDLPNIKVLKYLSVSWPPVSTTSKTFGRLCHRDTSLSVSDYVRDLWDSWRESFATDDYDVVQRAIPLDVDYDVQERGQKKREWEYRFQDNDDGFDYPGNSGWLQIH